MKLNAKQEAIITEHTLAMFPNEAVICITARSAYPMKNIHATPETDFSVSAKEFYQRNGIALVHSHTIITGKPNPLYQGNYVDHRVPSAKDMSSQYTMDVPFGIVSTDGEVVSNILWFPDLECNLVGNEYTHGVYDCFTIVRAYYWQNYKIKLREFPRDYAWWNVDPNIYKTHYQEGGFYDIKESDLEVGDLIVIRLTKDYESHGALYLGGDTILHHMNNRLSGTDSYAKWRKKMVRYLRHKDKPCKN